MSVDVKLIEISNDGSGGATSAVVATFTNVQWPGVIPADGSSFPPTQYQPGPNHVSWAAVWEPYGNAPSSQVEEWPSFGGVKRIHIQNQLD